ncbi:MAG: SOS response-associated peptidase [Anaerolineales bacterium]
MCGRFTLITEISELQQEFSFANFPEDIPPRYNIAPSQPVAVIANIPNPQVDFYVWGLIPHWSKDPQIGNRLINARAETLADKPAFRGPFRYHRCLILADGFFEWKKDNGTKTPYLVRLKSQKPFAFAGLWDKWQSPDGSEILSCTIITTNPNELLKPIHDRMPAILSPQTYLTWINPEPMLPAALKPLLQPYPAEQMIAYPVSRAVNDPQFDDPQCVLPVAG